MSTNKQIIQGAYQAFAEGDVPRVLALMDDKIEWTEAEGFPLHGTYVDRKRLSMAYSCGWVRSAMTSRSPRPDSSLKRHRGRDRDLLVEASLDGQASSGADGARLDVS